MTDASHYFGTDFTLSATGDLLTVSDPTETTQRLLRRLLTALGGYIWQTDYGAGLPEQVGTPLNLMAIQNIVRAQIFKEDNVAKLPEPTITSTSNATGLVQVNITYTDATSGTTQTLTVPVA